MSAAAPAKNDMKLEVAVIPVSDVDRAKRFYQSLGWRLDADFVRSDGSRAVQFTPPGSPCSIHLGASPKPLLFLVVSDVETVRAELGDRGIDVSEVFHRGDAPDSRLGGPDPERKSYSSFAAFSDPDGNDWLLQEVTNRLPGRIATGGTTFASSVDLAAALRRAAKAHGEHEERSGGQRDANWPDWYADYLAKEQSGQPLPT
jgi:catechol 2,3-dioxygenase-like lactoylglutathione lyase family enzyme